MTGTLKLGIRKEEVGIMKSKKEEDKSTSLFLTPNSCLLIFNFCFLIPLFGSK
jgi:hypothetical protein